MFEDGRIQPIGTLDVLIGFAGADEVGVGATTSEALAFLHSNGRAKAVSVANAANVRKRLVDDHFLTLVDEDDRRYRLTSRGMKSARRSIQEYLAVASLAEAALRNAEMGGV